ncbi:hypothetical protein BYT27DRAFT_7297919 [Phlegmacium glaucopus]|nr:hypothetical protein BYT27DRAFT_7297919 [Phlegmacium glaucopus]
MAQGLNACGLRHIKMGMRLWLIMNNAGWTPGDHGCGACLGGKCSISIFTDIMIYLSITSEHTDEVEIAASVAHSQPLENAASQQGTPTPVLDTSDTPRKRRQTTPSSEQSLKVPTSVLDEDNQLQGAITVSQHGSSESTTQNPIVPYLESMRNTTQGTEGIATKPEYSSKPGTPPQAAGLLCIRFAGGFVCIGWAAFADSGGPRG